MFQPGGSKHLAGWIVDAYDEKIEWFEKQGEDYIRGYLDGVGKFRRFMHRHFNEFGDVACAEMALADVLSKPRKRLYRKITK